MKLPTSIVALSTALFTSGASALSLGGSLGGAVLGRPLDIRFQIQPDAGQLDNALCVAAQVVQGDGSAGATPSMAILPLAVAGKPLLVRVRTDAPIREPVVMVQLSAGCTGTVRRSYTFLADLPESVASAFQDSSVRVRPLALDTFSSATREASQESSPVVRAPGAPPVPVVRRPAKVRKHWPTTPAPVVEPTAASAPSVAPAPAPVPAPAPAPVSAPAPAPVPTPVQPRPTDRLVMEPVDALPDAASTSTTALPKPDGERGSEATEAPASSSAQAERQAQELLQLRSDMAALRANLQELRAANAQLQQQLEQAQQQGFSATLVYVLLGLLAAALAAALWLWKRARGVAAEEEVDSLFAPPETNAQRPSAWAPATTTLPSSLMSEQDSEPVQDAVIVDELAPETLPSVDMAFMLPPDKVPTTQAQAMATAAEATTAPAPMEPTRRVINPETIFDLQQQAEFFISVGENDQAIEVMKQHIAENETTSPLAYLELLRLYHSLGRVEEFNQLRGQFEQHFNAGVPEFARFSQTGRSLLGYTDVLARIEAQWNSQEVLEELAHCLFQRDGHTPVFDLNAYDDLMLLYAIAQTTPPHARGLPLPRSRTTPQEDETSAVESLPEAAQKKGVMLSLPPELNWTPPPLPAPAPVPVPASEPELQSPSLSMDDFSWAPPSKNAQAPAVAPALPESDATLDFVLPSEPEPEPAPGLTPEPQPEPSAGRRILIDGEEFHLDFTLPAGLEQELMALAAPPVVSPPAKAPVGFGEYSDRFDIGTELQKRPTSANKPSV